MEERIITINIRKKVLEKPRWKRSKSAIFILKRILEKRLKSKKIKIGKSLNEKIWKRGAKKPSTKIRIKIKKENETFFVDAI